MRLRAMRRVLLTWALAALLSKCTQGMSNAGTFIPQPVEEVSGDGPEYTIFNNIKVPFMTDIEGSKFNETIQDGWW